jgi:uncharacterized iron-regulated protein
MKLIISRYTACIAALAALTGCVSPQTNLSDAMPAYLLLGEVHDNPEGHAERFAVIERLVKHGYRPAIVMEQFNREQSDALTQAQQTCKDAQCIIAQAGNSNWEWPLYYPVINLALQYQLPIIAGNVSRNDAARVRREGWPAALNARQMHTWQLPASVSTALRTGQENAIISGHCDQRPPQAMLDGFVNAQIVRDIWMAQSMIDNSQRGVILIAGNGHVRNDVGVPYWLNKLGKTNVQSIGFIEHNNTTTSASYDRVHTITPHNRPNPCAHMNIPGTTPVSQPTAP